MQNWQSSAKDKKYVTLKKGHQGNMHYHEIRNFSSCDYVQQRKKKNPEGTIINKQCVFIIRGKSVVFSSKTWSGRNTITVWHAVYFSFYNKPRVQGI